MIVETLRIRSRRWGALTFIAMFVAAGLARGEQALATFGDSVAQKVSAFERTTGGKARVGVSVLDLSLGKPIASVRQNELFIPASNQKLLSSAFAMNTLGGDYKFTTELYITRSGDMVVYGDFDPTLGDPELASEDGRSVYAEMDRWAVAVKKHLGDKQPGKLFVSGGSGVYRPDTWKTAQNHLHYQAPAAKLNFHRNCISATFKIANAQALPIIIPQSRFISVRNSLRVGGKQVWSMRLGAEDAELIIRGTIKNATPYPQYVPVNVPPMLFARTLADRLIAGGVPFAGKIKSMDLSRIDRKDAKPVCTTTTPLARAMKRANKDSLNMAAESFLLRCGDGTWPGSAAVMEKTLTKAFGLSPDSLIVSDGSGLSRKNRVSPATMTTLLAGIAVGKHASVLTDSLARAGIDGTLKKRMTTAPCKGRIIAKTGYILGVSCLSGYVLDKTGRPAMAFSIMANNMPGRVAPAKKLQESICAMLVKQVDKE
jgi:D-alanyl-D-alanine carboxypeptidase/D-alanyl-D-alanine-endopeptidase (penicillin-binding protein 4)